VKYIFIIVSVLITYGSFYPFDFDLTRISSTGISHALNLNPFSPSWGDILGNIILFVPFGVFGIFSITSVRRRTAQVGIVVILGFLLALLLQVGQLFLPSRDPSLSDVFWNLFGVFSGTFVSFTPVVRRWLASKGDKRDLNVPLLLSAAWVAKQLVPFVPTLDHQAVKDSLKPLFINPEFYTVEMLLQLAAWLVVFRFLSFPKIFRKYLPWLPALPIVVLMIQPFIVLNDLSLEEIFGAVGALLVWFSMRRSLGPAVLATLLGLGLVGANLYPLDLSFTQNDFLWIPFTGFLEGSMVINSAVLLEKVFLYGALVWLLKEAGLGWKKSTALIFVGLLVQEVLQIYVPGSTPEVTDPVLAVVTAVAMYQMSISTRPGTGAAPSVTGKSISSRTQGSERPYVRYFGSLDGLRGLAALGVFGVHFNQSVQLQGQLGPFDLERFLANGNTGVALFFVLSGFLLSIPFWSAHRNPARISIDLKVYAIRRLARILPAYYFCLVVILLAKIITGHMPSVNNVLSHFLFTYNLKDWNILSLNPPFWTLVVEMQFYLLLPFLFMVLRRLNTSAAFVVVIVLSIGTYLANYGLMSLLLNRDQWPLAVDLIWPFALYISGPDSFVLKYSTLAHLTYFLIGMATAWLFINLEDSRQRCHHRYGWANDVIFWASSLIVLVILATPVDDVLQLPFGRYNWPVVPVLLAMMIFTGPNARFAGAILEWAPIRLFGVISYGVYIYHYPLQKVTAKAMAAGGLVVTQYWVVFGAISFMATILMASLSYALLERPFMRMVKRKTFFQRLDGINSEEVETSEWTRVVLEFTVEQTTYLNYLSKEKGKSLSGVTRYVISQFIRGLEQGGAHLENSRGESSLAVNPHVSVHGVREQDRPNSCVYQQLVNLRTEQAEFIRELSVRLEISRSRTAQMIVDDFIKHRGIGQESGA